MSFFERLTGTVNVNEDQDGYQQNEPDRGNSPYQKEPTQQQSQQQPHGNQQHTPENETQESGELAVDVYETPNEIVIQTMVGGVHPEDLDVSITREMCTISGNREGPRNVARDDYFHQELYWGPFSRQVMLPQEVEPEEAEAIEKHGLLIIKLPKIDKDKQTKLEVESQE